MFDTDIATKKHELVELRETLRAARTAGDKSKSVELSEKLAKGLTELTTLEKQQDAIKAGEAAEHALGEARNAIPVRSPKPVEVRPEAQAEVINSLSEPVVRRSLKLGVKRTAELHALEPEHVTALGALGRQHERAFSAYLLGDYATAQRELEKMSDREASIVWNGPNGNQIRRFAMSTDDNSKGGFLTPPTYLARAIEMLAGMLVMRRISRVEPTRGDLHIPVLKNPTTNTKVAITDTTGVWVKEGNRQSSEQTLQLEERVIPTTEWQGYWLPLTQKLLRNAGANVLDIVSRVLTQSAGIAEEAAFWTGDGIGKPQGLLTNAGFLALAVTTGDANLLTYKGVRRVTYNVPAQYRGPNARYVMNSVTYGEHLLGLESTGGYLVIPPNSEPNTLWGHKIEFCEFLDDVAANKYPILYGDFTEAYIIAEEAGLRILRSDEKFIPQVGFLPILEVGGQVGQIQAARPLQIAA